MSDTATAAAPSVAVEAPAAVQAAPAQAEAKPALAVVPAPPRDEIAESLAALNQQIRQAKGEREKFKGEATKLAERAKVADSFDAVKSSLASKDFKTALRSLDPNLSIDEVILTLIEQASAEDAKPLSQADIERITAEKIAQDRKAREEEVTAQNAKRLEQSVNTYVSACADVFTPEAYPLIAQFGVSDEQIKAFSKESFEKDGLVPSPADTMKHFEATFERKAVAAGYSRAQIAAMKEGEPVKDTPTAPVSDTRGAATEVKAKDRPETMAEYDERVKAQFKALRNQAR